MRHNDYSGASPLELAVLLLDSLQDQALIAIDPAGYVLSWTKAAERFSGFKSEDIIGSHCSRFYSPEDIAANEPQRELDLAAEKGAHKEEGWRVRKDGSRFWASVTTSALRDKSGKLLGYGRNLRDFTEVKDAEQTLDQIFSESPSFMVLLSVPDYRFLRTNKQHEKLIRKSGILGKKLLEVEPELEAQGIIKLLDEVVATGRPYVGKEAPIHYAAVNGEPEKTAYLDFVYQPLRQPGGKVYAIAAQGYDVTDQVLARKAVENERENFRNLFRETPEMVCVLKGPQHVFEFVNEAHIQVLGFDATGMSVRRAQPESVEVHGILDEVYKTGKTAVLKETAVTVAGRQRFFNLTFAARRDDAGAVNGIMVLGVEITDQVHARESQRIGQQQIDSALKDSQALLNASPSFFGLVDSKTFAVLVCNNAALQSIAKNRADVIGSVFYECPWWKPVPASSLQVKKALEEAARGIPFEMDLNYWSAQGPPEGQIRTVKFRAVPVYGDNNTIEKIAASGVEITEMLQAKLELEEAAAGLERAVNERTRELRNSQNFLDSVIENIPNMVFVKESRNLKFVRFNKAGEDLLGIPRAQMIGKNDYDFFPKNEADHFVEKDREVLSGHSILDIPEETIQTHGKGQRILHTRKIPIFGSDGHPEYLLGISEDITEWKSAESERLRIAREQAAIEERKRENERASFLAEASTILASSLDYTKTLQDLAHLAVPSLADWCIVTILKGGDIKERVAIAHRDLEKAHLIDELAKHYPRSTNETSGIGYVINSKKSVLAPNVEDSDVVAAAKNRRHLEIMRELGASSSIVSPIMARGKALGAIALISGPGARRYNENDLAMVEELGRRAGISIENAILYETAQKAVQSRDEFLSIASHELKTPLTTLKLQAQIRKRDVRKGDLRRFSPEKLPRLVDEDDRQVNRLIRLVDDMLDISRIQRGKLSLNPDELDLTDLIRDVLARFSEQAEISGSRFIFEAKEPLYVTWDRFRMEQVLANLLTNAIKYGDGTPIRVEARIVNRRAFFSVADQGFGIEEKDQERIFGQFERAIPHNAISGLGLGLFISRKIVEAHGGTIRVVSSPGKGSCFEVEAPLKAPVEKGEVSLEPPEAKAV